MNKFKINSLILCALSYSVLACSDDEDDSTPFTTAGHGAGASGAAAGGGSTGSDEPDTAAAFAGCERGTFEEDFEIVQPLVGPSVIDGALQPGEYLVSTTYLQLRQEPSAQARFGALMEPIMAELMQRDGLLALSLGQSPSCGVARTLSIWRDDVAMLGFVTSAAHTEAMRSVTEVSRGGSLVTHWMAEGSTVTWQSAADHAGAQDGPFY